MLCVWNPFIPIANITLNNKQKVDLTKIRINNNVMFKYDSLIHIAHIGLRYGLEHFKLNRK